MPTNLITNILTNYPDTVAISNEVAKAISKLPLHSINWTAIITIITLCLTTMGTILGLFRPKPSEVNDEKIKDLTTITNLKEATAKLEKKIETNKAEVDTSKKEMTAIISEIQLKMGAMKNSLNQIASQGDLHNQTYNDLIKDYSELTNIFQDLIRTLSSYMGNEL
jgi:hypothetical protein